MQLTQSAWATGDRLDFLMRIIRIKREDRISFTGSNENVPMRRIGLNVAQRIVSRLLKNPKPKTLPCADLFPWFDIQRLGGGKSAIESINLKSPCISWTEDSIETSDRPLAVGVGVNDSSRVQPGLVTRIKRPETLLSFPITELPWQDQRVLVYTKKKGNSRKASILRKAITRVGG